MRTAGASRRGEAIAARVIEQLRRSLVSGGFLDATTNEVTELVSVDVISVVTFRTLSNCFRVKPGLAQFQIGNGTARSDQHAIGEREMVHRSAPRRAIANEINAMAPDESEFVNEPLKLREAFLAFLIAGADDGDAGRKTETARGLGSQRRRRESREGEYRERQQNQAATRELRFG